MLNTVEELERRLGVDFEDKSLAATALDVSTRGFSRLEFMGDAVMGLVVAAMLWAGSEDFGRFSELVSNEHLSEIRRDRLGGIANRPTGDHVEAVIGATYLDLGFDAAAEVVRLWIAPDLDPVSFGSSYEIDDASSGRQLHRDAFLGDRAIGAVMAHHLVIAWPDAPHRAYARCRSMMLTHGWLIDDPKVRGAFDLPAQGSPQWRYDLLQARVAHRVLRQGWGVCVDGLISDLDLTRATAQGYDRWR